MTIGVQFFDEENRMEISWDSEDPQEYIFNEWTEEDFLNLLRMRAEEAINNFNQCISNDENTNV